MSQSHQLSELQLAVMRVLWERTEATVAEVHASLAAERKLAPTTVATVLSRLEKRGLLSHRTESRQFVYRPVFAEHELRRSMVAELTDRLFQGNATALVSHLLTDRDFDRADLARVKALIEARELERGEEQRHAE